MYSLYKNQNKIILLTKMIRTFTRWRYQKNTFNKFLYFMGGMVFALGIVIIAQYEVSADAHHDSWFFTLLPGASCDGLSGVKS